MVSFICNSPKKKENSVSITHTVPCRWVRKQAPDLHIGRGCIPSALLSARMATRVKAEAGCEPAPTIPSKTGVVLMDMQKRKLPLHLDFCCAHHDLQTSLTLHSLLPAVGCRVMPAGRSGGTEAGQNSSVSQGC